ncbi:hypothetical protein TrST_g10718 [Triparma strigata]|uniref:SET domain-containing protein n=1 Tax=Triparma strigata TaxID=1606541 RepID=A0A9W7E8I7_9STRA|nr:hypothetical protein TrST_g10718 [Triparma strigata]
MKIPQKLFAQDTAAGRELRLTGLSAATVLFAASAGIEGVLKNSALLACVPGSIAAAVIASRSIPAPVFRSQPLQMGVDVEVLPSEGRGEGLFALRTIEKGSYIFDYLGETLSQEEIDEKYVGVRSDSSSTAYLLELNGPLGLKPTFVDAFDPTLSNAARFMNHGGDASNLYKFKQRYPTRRLSFFAKERIESGEELLWNYGASYWSNREEEIV